MTCMIAISCLSLHCWIFYPIIESLICEYYLFVWAHWHYRSNPQTRYPSTELCFARQSPLWLFMIFPPGGNLLQLTSTHTYHKKNNRMSSQSLITTNFYKHFLSRNTNLASVSIHHLQLMTAHSSRAAKRRKIIQSLVSIAGSSISYQSKL